MRPSETVAEVLRRVLVPAATGGALHVGAPFGRRAAAAAAEALGEGEGAAARELRAELSAGAIDAVEEAVLGRLRALAAIDLAAIGPRLDGEIVRLAALFHDALVAFHPDLVGVFGSDRPERLLEATAKGLAEAPPPATVRDALLRHAWLGPLCGFELTRTSIKFWVGSRELVGRDPPSRLLAWPKLRRVQRTDRRAPVLRVCELFADDARGGLAEPFSRVMACFLRATPLTDLALADRLAPPFVATETIAALVASEPGRRLARRALSLGGRSGEEAVRGASPKLAERLEIGRA